MASTNAEVMFSLIRGSDSVNSKAHYSPNNRAQKSTRRHSVSGEGSMWECAR
jgi:hypothetical protein